MCVEILSSISQGEHPLLYAAKLLQLRRIRKYYAKKGDTALHSQKGPLLPPFEQYAGQRGRQMGILGKSEDAL